MLHNSGQLSDLAMRTTAAFQPTGRPASALNLHPPDERLCPKCKGFRVLQVVGPDDETLTGDNNLPKLMDCPVCNRNGQQEYLERICGLSDEMRGWIFENTTVTESNGEAYDYLAQLAVLPRWFITLHGGYGVGKTRLLSCLVNAGRANGWTSVYTTMAELLGHLRSAYNPQTVQALAYDAVWDRITKCRILAIDEADRWNPTPWAQEKFFELIEKRYRAGCDLCTAFATNADIATFDSYLVSRMQDRRSRIYHIGGGDWRA